MPAVPAPPTKTSPESGDSNKPATCSKVDLPAPDGAISATDWPDYRARSTPRRISSSVSPPPKCFSTACSHSAGVAPSFIAQRLDRIEPRRPPGWIERGGERQRHGHDHDGDHVRRLDARRK